MADATQPVRIEDTLVAQERQKVLVIDYGSQYTQLITRRCGSHRLFAFRPPRPARVQLTRS